MLGITIGFSAMVGAVGLGRGVIFDRFPALHPILEWIAFAYLLHLAYRIATAETGEGAAQARRPLSFLGAAAFLFGAAMARLLRRPGARRWFNLVMAALLIASVLPSLINYGSP